MTSTSQDLALACGKTDNATGIYRNVKLFIKMYEAEPEKLDRLIKSFVEGQ